MPLRDMDITLFSGLQSLQTPGKRPRKVGCRARGLQWNPSKAATVGEWNFGRYTEVTLVEGFQVLGMKHLNKSSIIVCTEVVQYVHVVN